MNMQAQLGEWHRRKYPNATLSDIGLKLAEECGEVCRAIDRIHYAETPEEATLWRHNLMEEMGDITNVLLAICARNGADFEGVVERGVEKILARERVGS